MDPLACWCHLPRARWCPWLPTPGAGSTGTPGGRLAWEVPTPCSVVAAHNARTHNCCCLRVVWLTATFGVGLAGKPSIGPVSVQAGCREPGLALLLARHAGCHSCLAAT